MKYLKSFNLYEKLGINFDMDSQVDAYMKVIENSNNKVFRFVYKCDIGEKKFKLEIDSKLDCRGDFCPQTNDIRLKTRSRATLLHELKHLDYSLRSTRTLNNIYFRANNLTSKIPDISKFANIFYSFTEDEFQAKYHSYYLDFDNYLSSIPNLTPSIIVSEFYKFLDASNDKTWTWYFSTHTFKFSLYLTPEQQNNLFKNVINPIMNNSNGEYSDDMKQLTIDTSYLNIVNMIKSYWKDIKELLFGKDLIVMSDVDNMNMSKNIKILENGINKKKLKYRKRMERLITIMVDKYIKK